MMDQIKSRMEVLLQLEIEERTVNKTRQAPSSTTSVTSSVTGKTRTASSVVSDEGRDKDQEETKADLLFNIDSGKNCSFYVTILVLVSLSALRPPPPPPPPTHTYTHKHTHTPHTHL